MEFQIIQAFDAKTALDKPDMIRARVELTRMFAELSDEALLYVWRPILYSYFYTDEHDDTVMTGEDLSRFILIISAAIDPLEIVKNGAAKISYDRNYPYGKSR